MMRLRQMLRSDDMLDFNLAVGDLSVLPREDAIALLEELARESVGEFRSRAVDGMATIAPEHAEALAIRSLDDPEWFVRGNAIDVLSDLGSSTAIPGIKRLLATDPDAIVRSWAAYYLGQFGDESVLPDLEACVQNDWGVDHEGQPIRSTAQRAIAKIRSRLAGQQ